MRKYYQLFTDLDPNTGQTILWPFETSTTQGHWWLGQRPRMDLITQTNIALQTGVLQTSGLFLVYLLEPYNRAAFCNGNPDFTGYSQWIKIRDGT